MSALSLPVHVVISVVAAGVVWVAGIQLSDQTDVLSTRLHLGFALGGLILRHRDEPPGDRDHRVGLDAFGVRGDRPLTYRAASLVLVLEGALVVGVLAVVIAGSQLPSSVTFGRVAPASLLITVLWVVGLLLLQRAGRSLPWHESGNAPHGQEHARGHRQRQTEKEATDTGTGTAKSAVIFGVAALFTLVAGVVLEKSGDAIAGHIGLTGVLSGATVLAAATSLPELSTGLTSVKNGDYQLSISDIFGATPSSPSCSSWPRPSPARPCYPGPGHRHLPDRTGSAAHARVHGRAALPPGPAPGSAGVDSLVVLVLYAVGVVGLVAIAQS